MFARSLVILLLAFSESVYADSYLCVPDLSAGFSYNIELKMWESSNSQATDRKYLISPANTNDLFSKALKFDYEIKELGSTKSFIHCKTVRFVDSNKDSGEVRCRGSYNSESFTFNKLNGRYIRASLTGYAVVEDDSEEGNSTPFIEIGKCTAQ